MLKAWWERVVHMVIANGLSNPHISPGNVIKKKCSLLENEIKVFKYSYSGTCHHEVNLA